jgi:hypothetical protein
MKLKALALVAVAASAAYVPSLMAEPVGITVDTTPKSIMMTPGEALIQQIGDQHAVSFFTPGDKVCGLTVVLASSKSGASETDPHGTRITVPVPPGKKLHIDGTSNQSVDYVCGPKGTKMSTHVYDRDIYKGAKI